MGVGKLTPTSAVVRSSLLGEYHELARSLGLDPIALMKRAGIDRSLLNDPDLPLPMRALVKLLEITAEASGIEDFGLRLGEARRLPDIGPLTLMLREEATVRDALRTLIAYFHLHSNAVYMHLEEGDNPIITFDIIAVGNRDCRQTIDTSVVSLTSTLRWLLGEDWSPAAACFTHARPLYRGRYDRFFRCPIDFLHEFNGLVLRRKDLAKALPASSPALRREVQRYIRTLNVGPSATYAHRVTQVITMALPRGEARAPTIAHYLGTDCRTLNRRLARAKLNYSAVLEEVRKNLATQHLLGSDRPLSDICGLIGFASVSAFGRWFKSVYHDAPSSWRRLPRHRVKH